MSFKLHFFSFWHFLQQNEFQKKLSAYFLRIINLKIVVDILSYHIFLKSYITMSCVNKTLSNPAILS